MEDFEFVRKYIQLCIKNSINEILDNSKEFKYSIFKKWLFSNIEFIDYNNPYDVDIVVSANNILIYNHTIPLMIDNNKIETLCYKIAQKIIVMARDKYITDDVHPDGGFI